MQNRTPFLVQGTLWGLAAVAIWAGWWVLTRFSVVDGLKATDLAALRFGVAGFIMAPVVWTHRSSVARVNPAILLVMAAGAGAPYALIAALGLEFATAGNGGALGTGFLPVAVAILAGLLNGERPSRTRIGGLLLILCGAALVAGIVGWHWDQRSAFVAPALFFLSASMWASFTIAMRQSGLGAMAATAVVCCASAIGYLPIYTIVLPHESLLAAAPTEIAVQALYQGVFTSFLALFCFSKSIICIGSARAAAFPSLIPVAATLLGLVILGEVPSAPEVLGIGLISIGAWRAATAGPSQRRGPAEPTSLPLPLPER